MRTLEVCAWGTLVHKPEGRDVTEILNREVISRRKAISLVGLAAALGLAAPAAILTASAAEAQTVGMERRGERRTGRQERRTSRRTGRTTRREERRTGGAAAPAAAPK